MSLLTRPGLLAVLAALFSMSVAHAEAPRARQIGAPEQWIVPEARGYGDLNQGRPYIGVTIENPETFPIRVEVLSTLYRVDGSRDRDCSTEVSIAPGQRARAVCRPYSVVPLDSPAYLLTVRLPATALVTPATDYGAVDASLIVDRQTPSSTAYTAIADVRSPDPGTPRDILRFRFYAVDGTQVGECDTNALRAPPPETQRVQCLGSGPVIDAASPQPVTVSSEPSPLPARYQGTRF